MNDRDFAVVVGINTYRDPTGFKDLEGPTNDAAELIDWLKSPAGGGVPAANIDPYVRLSTEQRTAPTASDINSLLADLFDRSHPEDQPIGRRLYVFLAGHGFTNTVTLSLLHTVDTRRVAPAFVSGTQWLDCFHQRALFDELVLCMDCCRDYEPNFDPPGRPCINGLDPAATEVKRLYLLATVIGKGAYEKEFEFEGKARVHGLFSRALLDALRDDAIDGDGRMTAANVANAVREKLQPAAVAGQNIFPDPVCSDGFVLFENLTPRMTRVDVTRIDPSTTLELFAGNDEEQAHPIPPGREEDNRFFFELPRGKTYLVLVTNARGRTVRHRNLAVKNTPLALDV
jgi:hypothetical protein